MTAKELFNKLGWGMITATYLLSVVMYERLNDDGSFDMIVFNKRGGFGYLSYDESGKESGLAYFSEELLEAINKQIEELAIEKLKEIIK